VGIYPSTLNPFLVGKSFFWANRFAAAQAKTQLSHSGLTVFYSFIHSFKQTGYTQINYSYFISFHVP